MVKHRFYGLDLMKLWAFTALLIWHYVSVIWADYNEYYYFKDVSVIWSAIQMWCRSFAYGGQVILMITAFLTGYHGTKFRAKWFLAFLVLGIVVFPLIEARDANEPAFDWDIYGLILVGFLVSPLVLKLKRSLLLLTTICALGLMVIPFWRLGWFLDSPLFIRSMMVGDCVNGNGQWPLLPWLFFLIGFLGLGRLLAMAGEKPAQLKFHFVWVGFWGAAILAGIPYWGVYAEYPSNNETHCLLQTADPLRFWTYYTPVLALLHFSLMDKVNAAIKPYLAPLQKLEIVSSFWLPYFLSYVIINLMEHSIGHLLRAHPMYALAGLLLVWPLSEVISKAVKRIIKRLRAAA